MIIGKGPSPRGVAIGAAAGEHAMDAFLVVFSSGNAVIVQMFKQRGRRGLVRGSLVEEWMRKPAREDIETLHEDLERFMRSVGMTPPPWDKIHYCANESAAVTLEAWLELGIPPQ
jgi:hypothetical protein